MTRFTPLALGALLVALSAAPSGGLPGAEAAQPPDALRSGPPNLVIRPQRPGAADERFDEMRFLVIRPNGKLPSLATQPPVPAAPSLAAPARAGIDLPPAGTLPVPPPAAAKPAPDVVYDYWFAAAVEGQRLGYAQWGAKRTQKNNRELLVGVRYQSFTVSRFGQTVGQWGEESTVETEKGDVLLTGVRQGIGRDQALVINGAVEGNKLKVTGDGAAKTAGDTPWPDGVVGCVREPALFREKKLKPGESFDYPLYIGMLNRVVKMTCTLEAEEAAALWAQAPARKLQRYVTRMEPVKLESGAKFRLPPSTTWVDAETFEPLKIEFDFPGLGGRVSFLRTTREAATAPVTRPVELFNAQSIRLDREIPGVHAARGVVYKVTAPKDDDAGTLLPSDGRQSVKVLDAAAGALEVTAVASHGPVAGAAPQPAPGKEYTGSSYFINWDNDGVKAHAAAALRNLPPGAGAWEKAVAVERWVNRNMKAFEFSQAMAPADAVARDLSGDCTEYAMLGAAMCRAAGVPSRTVLGLVYAPAKDGKPYLAYHMWFEVYAGGQWVPLDATLGQSGVGPGHLKIADHSWHEEKTFAPLLPVLRVLSARPAVTVAKVEP